MNIRQLTFEHILYFLALAVALGVRLFNLGAAPLTDMEASWALQALQVAGRLPGSAELALGPQPAYVFLTGAAFALFGSANFLARFWPALLGGLLVLSPLFFRRPLGRAAALILAFGLALDPGLVAASRLAGGPMPALGFGLLALGFWYTHRFILAGVFTGLALLTGPALIPGLLGLGLAWGAVRLAEKSWQGRDLSEAQASWQPEETGPVSVFPTRRESQRAMLLSAGAIILLFGTLFMRFPQGLAAWFEAIPAYLSGWIETPETPASRLLAALILYQPLALIFGMFGAVRPWVGQEQFSQSGETSSRAKKWTLFLFLWAIITLVLVLVYPARQAPDLVWVLVPLWTLAAMELAHHLPDGEISLVSLGQAVLLVLLLSLFWYTLAALNQTAPGAAGSNVRLAVMIGILALGALTTTLVALGWSWQIARRGLVWGIGSALAIYSLSALWGAAYLRPQLPQELWSPAPATAQHQANLFIRTLEELSRWHTGFSHDIDIVVSVDSSSVRWALQPFKNARFVPHPGVDDLPAVIITRQDQDAPALSASYRGQDFSWWIGPGWTGALPANQTGWLTFREAPLVEEQIILWARSDLFPGGTLVPEENPVDAEIQ